MNTPRTRVQRRPVHGVLLLDKPLGYSSNQALQKAKWLLRAEKAGHTGTLDPLASGVLPLCFGAASKFSQNLLSADKTYDTTIALGQSSSTGDAEGDLSPPRAVNCTLNQVQQVLQSLHGEIEQIPPMYSALKKDGKALYEYARQGVSVERTPRRVQLFELSLLSADLASTCPSISLRVKCSKGTYIRTLGEDIGQQLGCGGHLRQLRRIASGPFLVQHCVSLADLEHMSETERLSLLRPIDGLLSGHTRVELDPEQSGRFLAGQRCRGTWPDHEQIMVFGNAPSAFLGTARTRSGELIAQRLLNPLEIQHILEHQS